MKKIVLVCAGCGVAGFLLGWVIKPAPTAPGGLSVSEESKSSRTGRSAAVKRATSIELKPGDLSDDAYFALASARAASSAGDGSVEQIELWGGLLSALTAERAPLLFDQLDEQARRGEIPEGMWKALLIRMGELSGRELVDKFDMAKRGSAHGLDSVVQGWVRSSPDEVMEWGMNLNSGHYKNMVVHGLFRGLVKDSPELAAEIYLKQPKNGNQRENRFVYVDEIRRQNGYAATLAALYKIGDRVSDSEGEDSARAEVQGLFASLSKSAGSLPWEERANALAAVSDHPFFPKNALSTTLKQGQWQDTGSVLDWVSNPNLELNDETRAFAQQAALDTIFANRSVFSEHLPKWMSGNPEHPMHDIVVERYVRHAAREDPDGADQWADTIRDEEARARAKALVEARRESGR